MEKTGAATIQPCMRCDIDMHNHIYMVLLSGHRYEVCKECFDKINHINLVADLPKGDIEKIIRNSWFERNKGK